MQTAASLPANTRPLWIARLGSNRFALGAAALGVIAAVATWQWSWLVAIGGAPLLLSLAPCAAMCSLGLCMSRIGGRACNPAPRDGQAAREIPEIPSATKET